MPQRLPPSPLFANRRAGLLLHPTSLPGAGQWGTLGEEAYHFIDTLSAAGCSVWQMLPIGPTHDDLSPYQSLSTHAGNPDLIDCQRLVIEGWVHPQHCPPEDADREQRRAARQEMAAVFFEQLAGEARTGYERFCQEHRHWLDDFALFQAVREAYPGRAWNHWPASLRSREPAALESIREELWESVQRVYFEQYMFHLQWQSLHAYASEQGVYLFGDLPIFVAHDSADVWANQSLFKLDAQGHPLTVAGVPPDYFSETGQHWGNPHYDWPAMEAEHFHWWLERLRSMLQRFDLIRIDHFRGFEAYWEIPADAEDAREGHWVQAPGRALLNACFQQYPEGLPLVAENLGLITEAVEALRNEFSLPGMRVLQFAFDGNTDNPHLPHNHDWLEVVYSGTHDNNTTRGWYEQLDEETRHNVQQYLAHGEEPMPWPIIRASLASVAQMAIVPMQDLLSLGSEGRMNLPGTMGQNWQWRFDWSQLENDKVERFRHLVALYGRL